MNSSDFVAQLRAYAREGESDRKIEEGDVEGDVDLPRTKHGNPLMLRNLHFKGKVDFDNSTFRAKLQFFNCTFDQGLNLSQATFENGLAIICCTFGPPLRDDPDLSEAMLKLDNAGVVGDISVLVSEVRGRMSARGLKLVGDLNFTSCTFNGKWEPDSERAVVDLTRSNIEGGVCFEANQKIGSINPPISAPKDSELYAHVEALLQQRGSSYRSIFGRPDCGSSVCMRNAKAIDVDLSYAVFYGGVSLSDVRCFSVSSRGGSFSLRPEEHRLCNERTPALDQRALMKRGVGTAEIVGQLDFSSGQIGLIRLEGIAVANCIALMDGRSGQIEIDDWCQVSEDNEEVIVISATCGSFYMSAWHCTEYLRCNFDRIFSSSNLWSIRGLHILDSKIDKDLTFWPGWTTAISLLESPRPAGKNFRLYSLLGRDKAVVGFRAEVKQVEEADVPGVINRWRRGLNVTGRINLRNCDIGGQLVLTAVEVVGAGQLNDGRIDVLDTRVGGNVAFSSPASYLKDPRNIYDFMRRLTLLELMDEFMAENVDQARSMRTKRLYYRAKCWSLDMQGLNALSVDVSGLVMAASPLVSKDRQKREAQFGYSKIQREFQIYACIQALNFRQLAREIFDMILNQSGAMSRTDTRPSHGMLLRASVIPSEIETLRRDLERFVQAENWPGTAQAYSSIPGKLDLCHAEIGELYLSDHSFKSEGSVDTNGVLLDFAKINYLRILLGEKMRQRGEIEHNGLPSPVSLQGLQVGSWDFEKGPNACDNIKSEPYLDLLDNELKFRVSSYTSIENSLRGRGLDDEADKILIVSSYRNLRSDVPQGLLRKLREWRKNDGRAQDSYSAWDEASRKKWYCIAGLIICPILICCVACPPGYWRTGTLFGICLVLSFLIDIFFGLRRPKREYVAPVATAFFCALLVLAVAWMASHPEKYPWFPLFAVGYLLIRIPFQESLTLTGDWIYWKFLKYGTNAFPLARIIVLLMIVSYVFVAGDRRNFEASTQLQIKEGQCAKCENAAKDKYAAPASKLAGGRRPDQYEWTQSERIWATLAYHVPVVDLFVTDDFEPADGPLYITGMAEPLSDGSTAQGQKNASYQWLSIPGWPKARDWFAIMQWLNWILWPLFLPYLIRKLTRSS